MHRVFLCAAAALVAFGAAVAPAAADDAAECDKASSGDPDARTAAIAACSRVLQRNPKDAGAYHRRGVARVGEGAGDAALADFSRAIKLTSVADVFSLSLYYNGRGDAYRGKGDYDRAFADYDEAIRLTPRFASAYRNRGDAFEAKGDHNRAIADYGKAIRSDSTFDAPYLHRAEVYERKGDFGRAAADYEQVIKLYPDSQNSHVARAGLARVAALVARPNPAQESAAEVPGRPGLVGGLVKRTPGIAPVR